MDIEKIAIHAAIEAGQAIMSVYRTDFAVLQKEDLSPLTLADEQASAVIVSFLKETQIPMINEEMAQKPFLERQEWSKCWIVDPLDGTKEFVRRNDEFTVNIALIQKNTPVFGVIYAPVLQTLYFTHQQRSYRQNHVCCYQDWDLDKSTVVKARNPSDTIKIIASRSHLSPETQNFIDRQKQAFPNKNILIESAGSSLKICRVAEGTADLYPRFAPTMEWDVAAGHAIAHFAQCEVIDAETGHTLRYNKENLLNPWFIVKRKN